jgi:hypothetical protein
MVGIFGAGLSNKKNKNAIIATRMYDKKMAAIKMKFSI